MTDRLHPESIRQIEQLARLHGVGPIRKALDEYVEKQTLVANALKDPKLQAEYDRLVYDAARDLAVKYRRNTSGMRKALFDLGVNVDLADRVADAQQSPEYEEIMYRGQMCDEGVIETLKDCLRARMDKLAK